MRISRLSAGFFLYRCYYPHRSRDALHPVCGIFSKYSVIPIFSCNTFPHLTMHCHICLFHMDNHINQASNVFFVRIILI